jgi:two-component sensor histidine kinase
MRQPWRIDVPGATLLCYEVAANGQVVTSEEAVRLGQITTELVINAVKHAFLKRDEHPGALCGRRRRLTQRNERAGGGERLGTSMVEVLARRLEGQVKVSTGSRGTSVIILGPVGRESTSAGRA